MVLETGSVLRGVSCSSSLIDPGIPGADFEDVGRESSHGSATQEPEGPLSTVILSQLHDVLEGAASGNHPLTPEDISLISAFVSNLKPASNDGTAPPEAESTMERSGGGQDELSDLEETTLIAGIYEILEC